MRGREIIPITSVANQVAPKTDYALLWARLKKHLRLLQKWWLRTHRPYQPVFVLATDRSGSNLLLSYLNQQPNVRMLEEVLSPRLPIGPSRDQLPAAKAIRHIRYCLHGEQALIRGCKLMLQQLLDCNLTPDDLNREFPSAKYIVLYRQSLAEQFVSRKVAAATGEYLVCRGQEPRQADIVVDPRELRAYCDHARRRYRDVLDRSWLTNKAMLLSYEELVDDPLYWLRDRICPLLDVPFVAPETRLVKQNQRSLHEQIVNYHEVAALLHSPLCRQQHSLRGQFALRKAA